MPTCDDLAMAARRFTTALDSVDALPDSPQAADDAVRARLELYMWFIERGWRPPEADAQSMLSDYDLLAHAYGSLDALPERQHLIRLSREATPTG